MSSTSAIEADYYRISPQPMRCQRPPTWRAIASLEPGSIQIGSFSFTSHLLGDALVTMPTDFAIAAVTSNGSPVRIGVTGWLPVVPMV